MRKSYPRNEKQKWQSRRRSVCNDASELRLSYVVVTSFAAVETSHRNHLRRLLEASPLTRVLWVNITFHELAFTTIDRRFLV
jgi:hypothetical protein